MRTFTSGTTSTSPDGSAMPVTCLLPLSSTEDDEAAQTTEFFLFWPFLEKKSRLDPKKF